jgi:transcriptional regulator with XRE-family HTH domain
MSQIALAHESGVNPTEVSRLERGIREPKLGTIIQLARGLKVAPSVLLRGLR